MPLATTTDADVLADLEWRHTEDATFSSGLWTLPEIANYLTERQNRFNAAMGLVFARGTIVVDANSKAALPADWIATRRVSWQPSSGSLAGRAFSVNRGDRFTDYAVHQAGATQPLSYDDHSGGTRVLELLPPSFASSGNIDLLYVSTLTALALNPATPVAFSVPVDFVPYLVYGVMADMLGKAGRGQDLERARYCAARWEEGLALAALLLEGFA
ncbi:MAG: hypothetical protein DMF56_27190 [Acidobacteria bacterium]|nr:MAG: hypothetical protein DMF56_27190 [Acidobacteriota bacterium]